MKNLVLFGPPGSGKGTQSALLIENYKFKYLATGDLLRNEIASSSELGQKAQTFIKEGKLVSDELVISAIKKNVKEHKQSDGFLFDGFPRTIAQAKELDKMLQAINSHIHSAIFLEVSREILIERLLERGKTSKRIDDTNLEVIKKRLDEYTTKTSHLKGHYANKIHILDGTEPIEQVFSKICSIIKIKQSKNRPDSIENNTLN